MREDLVTIESRENVEKKSSHNFEAESETEIEGTETDVIEIGNSVEEENEPVESESLPQLIVTAEAENQSDDESQLDPETGLLCSSTQDSNLTNESRTDSHGTSGLSKTDLEEKNLVRPSVITRTPVDYLSKQEEFENSDDENGKKKEIQMCNND